MKEAIILFVRNPEPGKVKKRLAKDVGDDLALQIYIQLLYHTRRITSSLSCDKFVYYADRMGEHDLWDERVYHKRIQTGNDLGQRMQQSFTELFARGYRKVIIIGSDCPGLSAELIEQAFRSLDSRDVVLGPAADGGYYLLGLTSMIEGLFANKNWSTNSVLEESLADIRQNNLSHLLLPILRDIDTMEDLDQIVQSH